jgi:AcrR family transcriptional regulator
MGVVRPKAKRFNAKSARSAEHDAAPLSERAILDAALQLIRRDGGDKLSMRTLASDLGVTPMAIYHYVPNKAVLVQKLGDSVMSDLPTPVPTGTNWPEEFKTYALEGWRRLAAHPGLTELLLKQPPTAATRRRIRYGASILIAAGFDERTAALTITNYQLYLFGLVSTHTRAAKLPKPQARRAGTDKAEDRLVEYLSQVDFDALIEDGIDTIIAGVRARVTPASAPRRARPEALDGRVRGRASRSS